MSELPLNASGHLPDEALYGYDHGLLTATELRVVCDHVARCADCRSRLAARLRADESVSEVRASLGAERSPSAALRWWAAAAAVFAAAAGGAWWAARRAVPVSLTSSTGEDARVRAALRAGRLSLPPFVKELSPAPEVLMGEAPPPPPRLSPAGIGVLDGTPRFAWEPVPGVTGYRVRVFTAAGDPVVESPELPRPEWTPDRPLPPGVTYQWQVEARRGGERIAIPEPPAAPPRFRVIDPGVAARLRTLAKTRPGDHLLLAVEYARAGVVDDARSELEAELGANPSRGDVRALLDSLDGRR